MDNPQSCCNSSGCGGCCGSGCGGCGGTLSLTGEEIDFLERFAAAPFLPVARKSDGETPVFLEDGADPEKAGETLMWLKLKGLITVDYDMPLKNFDYRDYNAYPVHGSMALTAMGQAALDALDIQGAEE